MDFYLTTSASTFPCFQINWLTSSCIKPVENLQPTCFHQAGASDVKAFWYRLDDCKKTSLQQTCVFLSVFDSNSAISLLWFYYDLGEIPSCFWQTSCWARKDCWRHREVADGNWTSKVKKPLLVQLHHKGRETRTSFANCCGSVFRNPPCKLSLWEETRIPAENLRQSAKRCPTRLYVHVLQS